MRLFLFYNFLAIILFSFSFIALAQEHKKENIIYYIKGQEYHSLYEYEKDKLSKFLKDNMSRDDIGGKTDLEKLADILKEDQYENLNEEEIEEIIVEILKRKKDLTQRTFHSKQKESDFDRERSVIFDGSDENPLSGWKTIDIGPTKNYEDKKLKKELSESGLLKKHLK